jgi:flavorubredoxin
LAARTEIYRSAHVHWPETICYLFGAYKILFTCDFFGCTLLLFYDEDIDELKALPAVFWRDNDAFSKSRIAGNARNQRFRLK